MSDSLESIRLQVQSLTGDNFKATDSFREQYKAIVSEYGHDLILQF
jgi:hypothetical protein